MIYIVTNIVPILLAGVAATVVLAGFRRGRTDGSLHLVTVAATTWLAAILAGALILAPVAAGRWTVALGTASIIWVGFVLPSLIVTLRSRRVHWGSAARDAGAWLAAMLAQSVVLQLVGLAKP